MSLTDALPADLAPFTGWQRRLTAALAAWAAAAVTLGLSAAGVSDASAQSQPARGSGIYSCTDLTGKRWTSDRPIPACHGLEQRVLNADGSVKAVVAPPMTADERAEREQADRAAAAARAAQQEAVRRDRNLLLRFRDEAAHRNARVAALDDVRKAVQLSERRIEVLSAERKPLMDETEFYVGRALPARLRQQIDANDATIAAQRSLMDNQRAEIVRINAMYDIELQRLKRLWAGAAPGSLGPMPTVGPVMTDLGSTTGDTATR